MTPKPDPQQGPQPRPAQQPRILLPDHPDALPQDYPTWLARQPRAHCTTCGAPVIWLPHVVTLKPAPIDAQPDPQGNILISERFWRLCPPAVKEKRAYRLHTPHFATCPQANLHRRPTQP